MKNILILGAGLMQIPAITSAKELNCKTFVADGNPEAIGSKYADEFFVVDLKDREGLFNLAKKINDESHLDAVFTAGTDFSANVAYIAEKFALVGHSFSAAINASDKIQMRKRFAECAVGSPKFAEITKSTLEKLSDQDKVKSFLLDSGFDSSFPYVVKPCDNMGGRGCRMINDISEFIPAVEKAIGNSRSGRAIFEEYMDGREFSIDSLVINGNVTITGFAERHIYYPPYFIEMGHTMSAELTENEYNLLRSEFVKAVHALGLTNGVAKADIKLTSKGAMIGEIAARLSGGYMSGWTFPYASGINLTRQALLIALGEKIEIEEKDVVPSKTCAERAWLSIPGKISGIYGYEDVKQISEIKDLLPRTKVGDVVNFPTNNVEKCGNVISLSENREKAISMAENAISKIVVRLEKNNPATQQFLDSPLDTVYPPSAYTDMEKNERDWNYRTVSESIELFTKIIGKDDSFVKDFIKTQVNFYRYLSRGGIQGILYLYDSLN